MMQSISDELLVLHSQVATHHCQANIYIKMTKKYKELFFILFFIHFICFFPQQIFIISDGKHPGNYIYQYTMIKEKTH